RPEVESIELLAVRAEVAEEAKAQVLVEEDEAAELAVERLDAGPHGGEVVVRREIAQVPLDEELRQADVLLVARRAFAHVGVDDAALVDLQEVEVEDAGGAELPVARLEGGVALEHRQRQDEVVAHEELVGIAEVVGGIRVGGAGT